MDLDLVLHESNLNPAHAHPYIPLQYKSLHFMIHISYQAMKQGRYLTAWGRRLCFCSTGLAVQRRCRSARSKRERERESESKGCTSAQSVGCAKSAGAPSIRTASMVRDFLQKRGQYDLWVMKRGQYGSWIMQR